MTQPVDRFSESPVVIQSLIMQYLSDSVYKMQSVCKRWHEVVIHTHNQEGNRYWSIYLQQLRAVRPVVSIDMSVFISSLMPQQKVQLLMQRLWRDLQPLSNVPNVDRLGRPFPLRGFLTANQYQELRGFADREMDRNFVALARNIRSLPLDILHGNEAEQAFILREWITNNTLILETEQQLRCVKKNITGITDEMIDLLKKMKRLNELWICNNPELRVIPLGIGQVSALQRLVLSRNGLTSLPGDIGNLEKLSRISVKNNQLTEIPASLLRKDMIIYASRNPLGSPEQVRQWKNISERGTYLFGLRRCAKISRKIFVFLVNGIVDGTYIIGINAAIYFTAKCLFYGGLVTGTKALACIAISCVAFRIKDWFTYYPYVINWANVIFGKPGARLILKGEVF